MTTNAAPPTFRFGKLPPKQDFRTLRFERYIDRATLPPQPSSWRIANTPPAWPMYGNDQYGDCEMATVGHLKQAWSLDTTGKEVQIKPADILDAYWAVGDIEHPAQPHSDQGLYTLDTLKYWAGHGIGGSKILAFVKVLPQDIALAAWLFDGVFLGFQCQQNVLTDFYAGRPWTPGTLTKEGHAVPVIGYDPTYLTMVTWASEQRGTYAWAAACIDEIWAIIPEDFLTKVPSGFDLQTLQDDLRAIKSGDSPEPAPIVITPPPPPPTPTTAMMAMGTQPQNGAVGTQMPGFSVNLLYADGSINTTDNTTVVTCTLPGFSNAQTVTAKAGVAVFKGDVFKSPHTAIQYQFAAAGLTPIFSAAFTITATPTPPTPPPAPTKATIVQTEPDGRMRGFTEN